MHTENAVKTAVVMGISSGIRLALAQWLLAGQYAVVGPSRSGELPGFSPRLHVVALEATDGPSRPRYRCQRAPDLVQTIAANASG